jgi:hypothetical protein
MQGASGFIKNPLGIIGLFVVLIYGLAVVVAGFSPELTELQRWVMIGLVAMFPPLVLWTLYRLVTAHHSKLYAPADWRDEKNFLVAMSGNERQQQLVAEANEVLRAEASDSGAVDEEEWDLPMQKLPAARRQLVSQIRDAETLALDALERKYGLNIVRDVRLVDSSFQIDGLGYDQKTKHATLFEVKFIRDLQAAKKILPQVIRGVPDWVRAFANRNPGTSVGFTLVLVTVGLDQQSQAALADWVHQRLRPLNDSALVLVFDLKELEQELDKDPDSMGSRSTSGR